MAVSLRKHGICHLFGDDVPHDEGVMAFKYAIERVTDANVLIPHLFEAIDPEFAKRVKPGDIVIAGRNFGHGKPHVQGWIAMVALGMGLLCESMPYKALRRSIASGMPVLHNAPGCTGFAKTGDEIEVDFETGAARNLTTGLSMQFPAMSPILRDIVVQGGSAGSLRAWLDAHPELAMPMSAAAE